MTRQKRSYGCSGHFVSEATWERKTIAAHYHFTQVHISLQHISPSSVLICQRKSALYIVLSLLSTFMVKLINK